MATTPDDDSVVPADTMPQTRLLSEAEAAEFLHVSKKTMRYYRTKKGLRFFWTGYRNQYDADDLVAFLQSLTGRP